MYKRNLMTALPAVGKKANAEKKWSKHNETKP
jgi:hypothetical protein